MVAKSLISKNQKHINLHELDRSNVKIWRSPHEDRFLLRDCISVGDGVVSSATADSLKGNIINDKIFIGEIIQGTKKRGKRRIISGNLTTIRLLFESKYYVEF